MSRVRLLERELYELIAAGEVIERPSSIIKELVENSIDSGASAVTVEIKRGGISYMRVTDNGSGIEPDDVSTAFLRHATSKIYSQDDLLNIHTLGFRGEALASVAAVAKVDVLTKVRSADYGTHYVIEGTEEKLSEKCGCPDGTTIVVRDIFYNVPARLKFLKKDVAEGNDIARIMEKIALSHPEISVKLIRDNKQVLFTPGDGKLYSAVYSVFGRQFAASLIPVEYSLNGIKVSGFTVKPVFGVKNRKLQSFFVNGRYVQTATCTRALEEAYKNCIMEGKFPACVLCLEVPAGSLDVNVHPQKIEVRFTEERVVYETVYFAVKNSVMADSAPNEISLPKHKINYNAPVFDDGKKYEQTALGDNPAFGHIRSEQFGAAAKAAEKAPAAAERLPERVTAEQFRSMNGADVISPSGKVELPWEKLRPAPEKVRSHTADNKAAAEKEKHKDITEEQSAVSEESKSQKNISEKALTEDNISQTEKKEVPEYDPPVKEYSSPRMENEADAPVYAPDDNVPESDGGFFDDIPADTESEEGVVPIHKLKAPAEKKDFKYLNNASFEKKEHTPQPPKPVREPEYRLIGEAFKTYIIAEMDEDIIFVDKHAAHERINFERMRSGEVKLCCQLLLQPAEVRLTYGQYDAVCDNIETIKGLGFDIEPLKIPFVKIKGIPSVLDVCDAEDISAELARKLEQNMHNPMPDILDDMLHDIACKASIRASDDNSPEELRTIVTRILKDEKIRYCPHGRPVMFKLKRKELEKQFRRIV